MVVTFHSFSLYVVVIYSFLESNAGGEDFQLPGSSFLVAIYEMQKIRGQYCLPLSSGIVGRLLKQEYIEPH